ncbi:MAG: hypothetical protein QXZ43_02015 [Candidatus Aenigmatarchaeota archaeon]
MKGEAENTIVRIVIALIVLGVVITLLYLGLGPFRASVQYNACIAYLKQYCAVDPTSESLPKGEGPCHIIDGKHPYSSRLAAISSCDKV